MPRIEVLRTYLEMTDPGQLTPAASPEAEAHLQRLGPCPASFYRYLYTEVGRRYHWGDRLPWSNERIRAHLDDPMISVWLLSVAGAPAGYFELRGPEDGSVEIAYFGLLPEFVGRGFGKYLLTAAVREAWALGARRLWLHTCSLDDPAALPNYVRGGFRPFKQETYWVETPADEGGRDVPTRS
jgi:GNAT superfamily N-acetyltransferase